MRKLNLAALSYERDGILNALERTNAVEVRLHSDREGTSPLAEDGEELRRYLGELEAALDVLVSHAERCAKENGEKEPPIPKDGFSVSFEDFSAALSRRAEFDALKEKINALKDEEISCEAEAEKLRRAAEAAEPYARARLPFHAYRDTLHTKTRLGLVSAAAWDGLKTALDGLSLAAYEAEEGADSVLLTVEAHKSVFEEVENLLSAHGFTACPYTDERTGSALVEDLKSARERALAKKAEAERELYALAERGRDFKIYCDRVGFELEKAELSSKLRGTERTFFLEAFVPEEREEEVGRALEGASSAVWYDFSDPAEDDEIPTLLKNNPVVKNFETITNMYSAPNAREFDPNTVMSFFYSVFLGFIMGDIGYGLLMTLGGGLLYFKNRRKEGGLKSLSGVFAVGGVFAVIWGFLFNSLFGIAILPSAVMPDPMAGRYTFVGIAIPSVLIISMLIGIIQIFAGYLCKAYQEWRVGHFWDGLLDGLVWAIFSIGAGLAIVGFVEEFHLPALKSVGGLTAAAALAVAVLTAGRKERLIGKFTKGFGSLYGIINYMSDVLSYARLYGLMLSGAVIAQIISKYAVVGSAAEGIVPLILNSNPALVVLGAALMVVGHLFNLAMGLLGAYIHDARLQYVEFYGRFYQGEGELFAPLGSKKKYIQLEQKAA